MELTTERPPADAALLMNIPGRYVVPPMCISEDNHAHGLPSKNEVAPDVAGAIAFLARNLYSEIIRPSLTRCVSREAYLAFIRLRWHAYVETIYAFHTLLARASSEEKAMLLAEQSQEASMQRVRESMIKMAGESAAAEVDFAAHAFQRAVRLVARFDALGTPENVVADRELCRRFRFSSALYVLSFSSLLALQAGVRVKSHDVFLQLLEHLRYGALDSYSSARQALDLRVKPTEPLELDLLPFDDEDRALSG